MSEEKINNNIENNFENIIKNSFERKALKPLKKIIGLFNIFILIYFFILQFNNISHLNYYIQLLLNEFICVYLWVEIRNITIKYNINKIKFILLSVIIFGIISFIYQLKTFPSTESNNFNNNNKKYLDLLMLFLIYISNIFFNLLSLFFLIKKNNEIVNNNINNNFN